MRCAVNCYFYRPNPHPLLACTQIRDEWTSSSACLLLLISIQKATISFVFVSCIHFIHRNTNYFNWTFVQCQKCGIKGSNCWYAATSHDVQLFDGAPRPHLSSVINCFPKIRQNEIRPNLLRCRSSANGRFHGWMVLSASNIDGKTGLHDTPNGVYEVRRLRYLDQHDSKRIPFQIDYCTGATSDTKSNKNSFWKKFSAQMPINFHFEKFINGTIAWNCSYI